MKKQCLYLYSLLAVALLVLAPGPALAAAVTPFTASGSVGVAALPTPDPVGKGLHVRFLNEPVMGFITASDWPTLLGAYFSTVHNSQVTFTPNGKFQGSLTGTFSLATATGIISGDIHGAISGNYIKADIDGDGVIDTVITSISDHGSWKFTAGANGEGTWSAELSPGFFDFDGPGGPFPPVFTLTGKITLQGKHK